MSLLSRSGVQYKWIGLLSLVILRTLSASPVESPDRFSSEKASFQIRFKDETSAYKVMAVFVLPSQKYTIEVLDDGPNKYEFQAVAGDVAQNTQPKWQWHAPQKTGLYTIAIRQIGTGQSMLLNAFVMVPYSEVTGEDFNGYRIGKYPSIPLKQLPIYKPPGGFVEVTKENEETLVSPHFKLKQFLCKQGGGYPKYLVLRERLLLKLELILEKVNEAGYRCDSFFVMSGYRTPFYNKAIGNVKYSRHVWGGAADIFIDENPKDGYMDDLNKDGTIDYRDAALMYELIDNMFGKPWYELFVGGLGRYRKTRSHGPFVHVDVRGFRARWGK